MTSLLEKRRANVASDFENTFAAMESKLEAIHTTVREHLQRIVSLEDGATSIDQGIRESEVKCGFSQKQRQATR